MSFKIYSTPFVLLFIIIFSCTSCSENNTPTNSGSEEEHQEINIELITSAESVRPGDIVIFYSNVDRITEDSLTGVRVLTWSSSDKSIKTVRQAPGVAAAFIPDDYSANELTITAHISKISDNTVGMNSKQSKTITIEGEPLPVEELQGFITSDTTLAKEKIYRLIKDISIENGSTLTITNGATLDLNGHSIISDNGNLNLQGTENKKVKIVVGEDMFNKIESNFNTQFAQLISSNNSIGVTVLGNSHIQDSEIFGHFATDISTISNSKVSKLIHLGRGQSSQPFSIEINNSIIYQLNIDKYYDGSSLSGEDNMIFILNFDFLSHNDISGLSTNFINNDISYLNISGTNNNEQTIFKKNNISRLLIEGNLGASIQQNNIGLIKNGFYSQDEEPFWNPSWEISFAKLNGPVVEINTSGQFEVQEFDLSNNYWAPEILEEMNEKGPENNITFIFDYYDDSNLDKVIYKNWSEVEFQ